MKSRRRVLFLPCLTLVLLLGAASVMGCGRARGGVEVQGAQSAAPKPGRVPRAVYVADFALDADHDGIEEGVRGARSDRLAQRLPRPLARDDSSEKARHIVDTMAESLVRCLNEKGTPAQRLRDTAGSLPMEGWLVQGVFTELDEGNRIKRAVIGFGKGATHMDVQIGISDLAGADPRAAFVVFGTVKDPSKMPGAIVTMNPYVAAAKFVLQKHATDRDIQSTAAQIADEVLKYKGQIAEQPASE